MKKLFLLAVAITVLTSCFKQKPKAENGYCACGRVEQKFTYMDWTQGGETIYQVQLKNRCTGNLKTFIINEDEYNKARVKEDMCMLYEENGW